MGTRHHQPNMVEIDILSFFFKKKFQNNFAVKILALARNKIEVSYSEVFKSQKLSNGFIINNFLLIPAFVNYQVKYSGNYQYMYGGQCTNQGKVVNERERS